MNALDNDERLGPLMPSGRKGTVYNAELVSAVPMGAVTPPALAAGAMPAPRSHGRFDSNTRSRMHR